MPHDARLRREISELGQRLGDVLRRQGGDDAFNLVERVRALSKQRRRGQPDAERDLIDLLRTLDLDQLSNLVHALSLFFDLANLAEDRHRVRVLKHRERAGGKSESLPRLAAALADPGRSENGPTEVQAILDRARIELVFTAHPTEAKRRSVREKVRDLRDHLAELDAPGPTPRHEQLIGERIEADVAGLWQTDLVRFRPPTVREELDRSLFFAGNLWRVAPRLYRDLSDALADAFPQDPPTLGPFLSFGTWIGGDRDGNPSVTAEVTRQSLLTLRREAITRHIRQAELTRRNLSISTARAGVDRALPDALAGAVDSWPHLKDLIAHLSDAEPYRRWLSIVQWRLELALEADLASPPADGAYTAAAQLVDDLRLMRRSLENNKGQRIARAHLDDWIRQSEVFGLHLMALDVRQESGVYHAVMAEVLAALNLCPDYADLDEPARQRVLTETLGRTDDPDADSLSDQARETLALFDLLAHIAAMSGPGALGAHIISMTHQPSDALAVLWFSARAARRQELPDGRLPMPIAPLFETVDDLHRGDAVVDALLGHDAYRGHVDALGGRQVVMIGYSDSTKDGGYLAACWALHEGQVRIHAAGRARGVPIVFFHGRGGSLGRGGGPAARAIGSLPPATVAPGLRMTEQGEVLSERYDDPEIAFRHLEQVAYATLLRARDDARAEATADGRPAQSAPADGIAPDEARIIAPLAAHARKVYRELVDDAGFIEYFEQATPIVHVEQLPIGSRPAHRRAQRSLQTLRAIPWVFSWTQSRHMIPAWYGLGSALGEHMRGPGGLEALRDLYERSAFFRAVIENAALALAKADLGIARHHASLVGDEQLRERIFSRISAEHTRSRRAVLEVVQRKRLLADVPWLKRSIEVRNPYVDPLNLIQVELIRRLRAEPDAPDAERTARLIRLSIQGIAGGLRTTG